MIVKFHHLQLRNKSLGKILGIFGIFLLLSALSNTSCSYAVTPQSKGLNQHLKSRKAQKRTTRTQGSTQTLQLTQFQSAASFVDSIGANVASSHLTASDKTRLQELGVRHIRVGFRPTDTMTQDKVKELTQLGIKLTIVMDPRDLTTADQSVAIAKLFPGSIAAIEGPNELDIQPFQYKGKSFPIGLRLFQKELYQAIKNDPSTAQLPVMSPSIIGVDNASVLGKVDCDISNLHYYPRGDSPARPFLDVVAIPKIKVLCGDQKPVAITETGYHNAIKSNDPLPGIPESITAKYNSRLLFEYFNRGINRSFLYRLRDHALNPQKNDLQLHFGLLNYDGTPKPAFNIIKNMISIFNTPAVRTQMRSRQRFKARQTFRARKSITARNNLPSLSLQGDLSNLHHTLLQESSKSFYLILWQEVESYSASSKQTISVPGRSIKVILDTPLKEATLYNPLRSANPISRVGQRKELNVSVPDHPLVFKLTFN
jgi:hypothetical protein